MYLLLLMCQHQVFPSLQCYIPERGLQSDRKMGALPGMLFGCTDMVGLINQNGSHNIPHARPVQGSRLTYFGSD